MQELRFAFRGLRRQPGFAVVAILTLALGIGANAAMFSVVHAVLLRPLPYSDADRLVRIRFAEGAEDTSSREASLPDIRDWRPELTQLVGLAAYASTAGGSAVEFGEDVEMIPVGFVTGNFFEILGVAPLLGRDLEPEDDAIGAAPVALIGEGLWRRRFGAQPGILGRSVRIAGHDHTIVGVVPTDVDYPVGSRLWVPVEATVDSTVIDNRSMAFLNVVARLAPEATIASADVELRGIVERVTHPKHPESRRAYPVFAPLREELFGDVEVPLLVLMAAAFTVLAIACANVANLQIVRGLARAREYAVRGALGARFVQLVRLSVVESTLLAALGALAALVAMSPVTLFRGETIGVDATVIAFAALLATLTAFAFGVFPVWHGTRGRLAEALRRGSRTSAGVGRALDAFVVAQVALALVLLVGAGLLVRSFVKMRTVDTGFDRAHTLMTDIALFGDEYDEPEKRHQLYERLIERVQGLPGVVAAGGILARPFRGPNGFDARFTIQGRDPDSQEASAFLNYEAVTPGYFDAAGIPLLGGRDFAATDDADAPGAVIVNTSVANRFWPGDDAIGQRIKWGGPESTGAWLEIVGVVGDARYRGVERVTLDAYAPFRQGLWPLRTLVVRAEEEPTALLASLRRELTRIEPTAKAVDAATTREMVAASLQGPRFNTTVLVLFGVLAMAIGALGLYGVLSFNVALRTRELGVRMALGATRTSLLALALRHGLWLTGAGVALGLVGAFRLTRLVTGLLFGISPLDAATFVAMPTLLIAVAVLASLVPARRASRVDPLVALREE